jgi:surface carbohydrate biosynthesis protein
VQIHKGGFEVLSKIVDPSIISIIDPSNLNFWILLKCMLCRKRGLIGYTEAVIRSSRPRVVITFIDNDTTFYLLKSLVPAPVYISIQNGIRNNYAYAYRSGFVDHLVSAGENNRLSADFICTFGKSSSTLFERHIQSKTLVTGNLKNNVMEITSPHEPEYDVIFMSQHAPFDLEGRTENVFLNNATISIQKFYEIEGLVAKFLAQYCEERSLRFAVSGKRGFEDNYEHRFFSEAIADSPFTFLPRVDTYTSYENGFNSRVTVVIDSTIGYELLSRGRRVAFFSSRLSDLNEDPNELKDSFFGYPSTYPDKGPFWTNQQDSNEYLRILESLLVMPDAEWAAEIQPYNEDLMAYRPGNSEFIQMLKSAGIKATSEVVSRA